MRNRISSIIIDPNKSEHDYNSLILTKESQYYYSYGEIGFDLKVLDSSINILNELDEFRGVDCIITIGDGIDFTPLCDLSIEYRFKWIHVTEFDPKKLVDYIINVFLYNINRDKKSNEKIFSIFTCTYKTPHTDFDRLYTSLLNQTYRNWNWFILDDSPNDDTINYITSKHDPRIVIVKNVSNHGNIGFNKKIAAMSCNGDYLVEVDHDDELTSDCLEKLLEAFNKYPDVDFVYSYALEDCGGQPVNYGDYFSYGLGSYIYEKVNGVEYKIATSPDINAISIRAIQAMPNHVRCWKSDFYRMISGHNPELSVLDDMDIIIRTFLYGKIAKIEKVLYIQHQGSDDRSSGNGTTQSKRFLEIQRTNEYLRMKYNKQIHERVLELGGEDPCWRGEYELADMYCSHDNLKSFNYTI